MKGCATSCLIGLVGYFALAGALYFGLLEMGVRRDDTMIAAFGVGFLITVALSFFWSAVTASKHIRLLRNALEGVPPVDGQWAGFSGIIKSRAPIVSPISGREAVTFKYDVWRFEGMGKHRSRVTYYRGAALAPSTISTNLGTYKLLSVPQFDWATSHVAAEEGQRNMRNYIDRTKFETRTLGQTGQHTTLEEEWSDDDGFYRSDIRYEPAPEVEEEFRCDEHMIEQGEQVCILGRYSQMKGGIVPDPDWSRQTRIVKGDGEAGLRKLAGQSRMYVILGLVLLVVSAGILWKVVSESTPAL